MPRYQTPGVYVEESSLRSRVIEGAPTGRAAFVGPTRGGPVGGVPECLRSVSDFERSFGGLQDLAFADIDAPAWRCNFVAHAVRAFFENGGTHLYVVRALRDAAVAEGVLREGVTAADRITLRARHAGAEYNGPVLLREASAPATVAALRAAPPGSLLAITDATEAETLYLGDGDAWVDASGHRLPLDGLAETDTPGGEGATASLRVLMAEARGVNGESLQWGALGWAPDHPRWPGTVWGLAAMAAEGGPFWADIGSAVDAFALLSAVRALPLAADGDPDGHRMLMLAGGSDGLTPLAGEADTPGSYAAALQRLETLDDLSTLAAPGSSAWPDSAAIRRALIAHAERPLAGCTAVLDSAPGQTPAEVHAWRAELDTAHAALYYPWVVVAAPLGAASAVCVLPPSGFVAGLYAALGLENSPRSSPAQIPLRAVLRTERSLQKRDFDQLNPLGINGLREDARHGVLVWGARTLTASDPTWRYVPVRRYMNHLETSMRRGLQWVSFEPNSELLWATVRESVEAFLFSEWRRGALLGAKPKDAYFVRCDRSTMTQNDIDNGRLVWQMGVALLRPAEFVIERWTQWTADRGPT